MGPEQLMASADHAASAALQRAARGARDRLRPPAALRADRRPGDRAHGRPGDLRRGPATSPTPSRAEFWERFEPLFSSALEGETRTREIWTADERHCLMVDAGPLCSDGGPAAADLLERRRRHRRRARHHRPPPRRPARAAPHADGFEEVFERAPIGTGLIDIEGRWLLVNRALCDITGYTSDELLGKRYDGIMHPEDVGNDSAERAPPDWPARSLPSRSRSATSTPPGRPSRRSSRCRSCATATASRCTTSPSSRTSPSARSSRSSCVGWPTTTRSPGLRNRRLFEHDLRLQVGRCQRYGETAGLMIIDLDDFRALNRDHGREAGDDTLKAVARALTRRLRETDLSAASAATSSRCCCRTPTRRAWRSSPRVSPRDPRLQHRRRRERPSPHAPRSASR